ncbi:class I SAM-dependent methyltransferase [Pontibacter sp. 172403-2]|uniref:class I SAM-dependent methyltransferase n=1 Tax=Pontibacter rufus TaxID=2791028 RepID=UPI0018AFAB00|nr:class I SAM-dependent methyltransferase [Pontibacter sp. 172403-2]MBF9253948.1 class I SAM-dependent methyltransferase [Pontibacter sp. 172403-2]
MPDLPDSGFHRVALFYDRLARLVYGDAQEQAQLVLLPFLPRQAKVLVIGGGSGWILEQLLGTQKQFDILYLDAAPAMLQLAEQRFAKYKFPHNSSVRFRLGTEQALLPHEQFDVVFTPFLLDLFPPQRLRRLMQRLDAALAPGGHWLFADFWPVQQPATWWQRLLVFGMYAFFGTVSGIKARKLPDYGLHFDELNLREAFSKSFYSGMIQGKVFVKQKV